MKGGRKAAAAATGGVSETVIRAWPVIRIVLIFGSLVGIALIIGMFGGIASDPQPDYIPTADADESLEGTPFEELCYNLGVEYEVPGWLICGIARVTTDFGDTAPDDIPRYGATIHRATGETTFPPPPVTATPPPPGTEVVVVDMSAVNTGELSDALPDFTYTTLGVAAGGLDATLAATPVAETQALVVTLDQLPATLYATPGDPATLDQQAATAWLSSIESAMSPAVCGVLVVPPDLVSFASGALNGVRVVSGTGTSAAAALETCVTVVDTTTPILSADVDQSRISAYTCDHAAEDRCGPYPLIGAETEGFLTTFFADSNDTAGVGVFLLDPEWVTSHTKGDPHDVAQAAEMVAVVLAEFRDQVLETPEGRALEDWQFDATQARTLWSRVLNSPDFPVMFPFNMDLSACTAAIPDVPADIQTGEAPTAVTSTTLPTSVQDGVRIDPCTGQEYADTTVGEPMVFAAGQVVIPVVGVSPGQLINSWGFPRSGGRVHRGIDIFGSRTTPVVAAVGGIVSSNFDGGVPCPTTGLEGLGLRVTDSEGNSWFYAHLSSVTVIGGQRVETGDQLGYVGNTGNACTTPPHLHLGINEGSTRVMNPYPILFAGQMVDAVGGLLGSGPTSLAIAYASFYGGIISDDPWAGSFPAAETVAAAQPSVSDSSSVADKEVLIRSYFSAVDVANAVATIQCQSGFDAQYVTVDDGGVRRLGWWQLSDNGQLQDLLVATGEQPTNLSKAFDPEWATRAARIVFDESGWDAWDCDLEA